MGVNGIAADAQHLGIMLLEPAVGLPEQGGLAGSTGGEVKDVEGQHHGFFAAILAQGNFPVVRGWQLEIWGDIANFSRHNHTPQDSGAANDAAPRSLYPKTPLSVQVGPGINGRPAPGGVILGGVGNMAAAGGGEA